MESNNSIAFVEVLVSEDRVVWSHGKAMTAAWQHAGRQLGFGGGRECLEEAKQA